MVRVHDPRAYNFNTKTMNTLYCYKLENKNERKAQDIPFNFSSGAIYSLGVYNKGVMSNTSWKHVQFVRLVEICNNIAGTAK